MAFGDPLGPAQLAGGAAIIAGIAMSTLPLLSAGRRRQAQAPRDQERNRGREPARATTAGPDSRSGLVGGLVLPHDLGADPAALGDRQARLAGPRPDGGAVHPLGRGAATAPPPAAAASSSAGRDERRERGGQPGLVRLRQVDLVTHSVDAEGDGLGVRRPVDVVCYYY